MHIIIILLIIIIIILCPSLLGIPVLAIGVIIHLVKEMAVPLSVYFIMLIGLIIADKVQKKENAIIYRITVFMSILMSIAMFLVFNYSGAYFMSYLIIYTSLIVLCVQAENRKEYKILNAVAALGLFFGFICFHLEFICPSIRMIFGTYEYSRTEREFCSSLTLVVAAFSIGIPLYVLQEEIKDLNSRRDVFSKKTFYNWLKYGVAAFFVSFLICYTYTSYYHEISSKLTDLYTKYQMSQFSSDYIDEKEYKPTVSKDGDYHTIDGSKKQIQYQGSKEQKADLKAIDDYMKEHPDF